jgi:hypothetical protein
VEKIMNEFVLIFRMNITDKEAQPTPEQMKIYLEQWDKWINDIASQNKLAEGGNHLSPEGRVLRPNNAATNGPYTEKKESVAGYIIIKATDFDEAVMLAKGCPILQGEGTSVEVRKVGAR